MAYNTGLGGALPAQNIPAAHGNVGPGGVIPAVNFGAIWDKFVNGNQAADILPFYNGQPTNNTTVPTKKANTSSPMNPAAPTTTYTASSTPAAPAYDQNVVSQYDTAVNSAQSALNRLPTQLGIATGNVNRQYTVNQNELNSTKNQANNSYTQSGQQNQQSFRTDKNAIADKSSQGLQGLLRMLGAYGAGGSSDARYVAPQAVATQASQERAGAGQTYAQNQSGLDTNWNNFLLQDTNSRHKLEDWRTQQINDAKAQSETTKQDLLSKLADLIGQRAAYKGGSYQGAAQPYVDQANALGASIDNLAKINPTYNGVTPVYNAPALSDYTLGQGSGAQLAQNAAEQQASPYLSLLLGQRDKNGLGA
jgi:hypothetical protein